MGGGAAGGDASSQVSAKDAVVTESENRNANKSLYDMKHSPAFFRSAQGGRARQRIICPREEFGK